MIMKWLMGGSANDNSQTSGAAPVAPTPNTAIPPAPTAPPAAPQPRVMFVEAKPTAGTPTPPPPAPPVLPTPPSSTSPAFQAPAPAPVFPSAAPTPPTPTPPPASLSPVTPPVNAPVSPSPQPFVPPADLSATEKRGTIEMSESITPAATAPVSNQADSNLTQELLEKALEESATPPSAASIVAAPVTPAFKPEEHTQEPEHIEVPKQPEPAFKPSTWNSPKPENKMEEAEPDHSHSYKNEFRTEPDRTDFDKYDDSHSRPTSSYLSKDHSGKEPDLPDVSAEIKRVLQERWITLAHTNLDQLAKRKEEIGIQLADLETKQRQLNTQKQTLEDERSETIKQGEGWNAKLTEAQETLDKVVQAISTI